MRSCALTASPRGAPSRQVGRPLGGARRRGQHSTAARGVREADEWLSPASRSTASPRPYAQNDMVCLAVAAATAKRPSSRQAGGIRRSGMVVLLVADSSARPTDTTASFQQPSISPSGHPSCEAAYRGRRRRVASRHSPTHLVEGARDTAQCQRASRPQDMCLGTQRRLRGRSGLGPGTAAGRPAQSATAAPSTICPPISEKTKLSCGEAVPQLLRYRHRLVRTGGRLRTAGAPPSPTFP